MLNAIKTIVKTILGKKEEKNYLTREDMLALIKMKNSGNLMLDLNKVKYKK